MNYPCEIIQDLLPLYADGICSEESKAAVEQHLSECSDCKEYYLSIQDKNNIDLTPADTKNEYKKAASFKAVRKKLRCKQILITAGCIVFIAAVIFTAVGILKGADKIVEYDENISVSMTDGSLVGRLNGSRENYLKIKRVTLTKNGRDENYLFYCLSDTKWDELITNKDVFSEYMLCSSDKGADEIDCVYYYTGDYSGIEALSLDELQKVIDRSVLLWSKRIDRGSF